MTGCYVGGFLWFTFAFWFRYAGGDPVYQVGAFVVGQLWCAAAGVIQALRPDDG